MFMCVRVKGAVSEMLRGHATEKDGLQKQGQLPTSSVLLLSFVSCPYEGFLAHNRRASCE